MAEEYHRLPADIKIIFTSSERLANTEAIKVILKECNLDYTENKDTALQGSLHVPFPESDITMSIITHEFATNGAFCETALKCKASLVYISELGYEDVCRWEKDELKAHLVEIASKVKGRMCESFREEVESTESDSDYLTR